MDYCEEIIMNDKFIDGNFISNKHELFSLQIENILYNIENLMITEQQEAYTDWLLSLKRKMDRFRFAVFFEEPTVYIKQFCQRKQLEIILCIGNKQLECIEYRLIHNLPKYDSLSNYLYDLVLFYTLLKDNRFYDLITYINEFGM